MSILRLMKPNIKLFISILVLVNGILMSANAPCETRTLTYQIYNGKDCIGSLKVKRVTEDSMVHYSFEMRTKFRLVLNFVLNQDMQETFCGGKLLKSVCIRNLDGKITINNVIQAKGPAFLFREMDHPADLHHVNITASMLTLYFSQPNGQKQALSESFLEMADVHSLNPNAILVTSSNGNKTKYTYTNGVCSRLDATGSWGVKLHCVLSENSVTRCE